MGEELLVYTELLEKLLNKHLFFSWATSDGQPECPAKKFVISLLREKIATLRTLKFIEFRQDFQKNFDPHWTPDLPRLRKLRMGLLHRGKGFLSWDTPKDFFLKLINGAPNLERLQGHFDPKILQALPQDKSTLVEAFQSFISSADVEETRCLELAKANPSLRRLELNLSAGKSPFNNSFHHVLE